MEKGYEFEINEVENPNELEIGIQTYKHVWSWWKVCEINEQITEFFRGSYSRNTGKTKKGVRRQRKVVTELHRQLGWESNGYDLFENLK